MTNTLNTPVESVEAHFPLTILRYAIRRGSGGRGARSGGDGMERVFRFRAPASVTLIAERHVRGPWGLAGGEHGAPGEATLNGSPLAGKCAFRVVPGDVLVVRTPGGGGHGA